MATRVGLAFVLSLTCVSTLNGDARSGGTIRDPAEILRSFQTYLIRNNLLTSKGSRWIATNAFPANQRQLSWGNFRPAWLHRL
jgi:hypothetical protein